MLARVRAAARDREADQVARRDAQPLDDRGGQRLVGMVERQFQVGDADHGGGALAGFAVARECCEC
jgi:hypothetical protein